MQDGILVPAQYRERNGVKETCSPSYSSPAEERSREELCIHGLREHPWELGALGPSTLGDEKVLCPPLQGTSTDPNFSLLLSLRARRDQVSWGQGGGIGFMKERQVLVVLSLSYSPFSQTCIFIVVRKNSPGIAAGLLEQISGIGEEYRDYPLLFAWFEQTSFTHLYSLHATGTNGGHKALCSCPGWRGEKKKKLHLIDRSLGFWSRSHA